MAGPPFVTAVDNCVMASHSSLSLYASPSYSLVMMMVMMMMMMMMMMMINHFYIAQFPGAAHNASQTAIHYQFLKMHTQKSETELTASVLTKNQEHTKG